MSKELKENSVSLTRKLLVARIRQLEKELEKSKKRDK